LLEKLCKQSGGQNASSTLRGALNVLVGIPWNDALARTVKGNSRDRPNREFGWCHFREGSRNHGAARTCDEVKVSYVLNDDIDLTNEKIKKSCIYQDADARYSFDIGQNSQYCSDPIGVWNPRSSSISRRLFDHVSHSRFRLFIMSETLRELSRHSINNLNQKTLSFEANSPKSIIKLTVSTYLVTFNSHLQLAKGWFF
jgi:hypothetical protein